MSQPRSCMLKLIMPGTCAPSTADRIPLMRARARNSLAGSTTPVKVRDVAEEQDAGARSNSVAEEIQDLRGVFTGFGSVTFLTTMP